MGTLAEQYSEKMCSKYWDRQAKKLHSFCQAPSTKYYLNEEKRLFLDHFGDLRDKKLLKLDLWNEVNNTQILRWVAERETKVFAIDISSYITLTAAKNFIKWNKHPRFATADMCALPFKTESLDCVYTMGTIEHVLDSEIPIAEIARILKRGGLAIVGVPNKADCFLKHPTIALMKKLKIFPYGYETSFSMKELENMLSNHNFEILNKEGLIFMPFPLRVLDLFFCIKLNWLCKFTRILIRPFEILSRKYKFFRKYGMMIACVVRKK